MKNAPPRLVCLQAILAQRSAEAAAGGTPLTSDEQHARSIARKICNGLSANLTVPCTVAAQQVSRRGGPTLSHSVAFLNPHHYAAALRRLCAPHSTTDDADAAYDLTMGNDGGAIVFPKTTDYVLRGAKLCTVSYLYADDPLLPSSGRAPLDCGRTPLTAAAHGFSQPRPVHGALPEPLVEFSPYVILSSFYKSPVSRAGNSCIPFDRVHPQFETHCLLPHRRQVVPCFTASIPVRPGADSPPEAREAFAACILGVFRDHDLVRRGVPLWGELLRWEASASATPLSPLGQYASDCMRVIEHNQQRGLAAAHSSANARAEAEASLLLRRTAAEEAGEVFAADPDALDVETAWPGEDNRRSTRATGAAYADCPDDLLADLHDGDDAPHNLEENRAATYARDALGDLADFGLGNATGSAAPPSSAVFVPDSQQISMIRAMSREMVNKGSAPYLPEAPPKDGNKQYALKPDGCGGIKTGYHIYRGPDTAMDAMEVDDGDFTFDALPTFERLSSPPSIADTILLFTLSDDQMLAFASWAEFLLAKVRFLLSTCPVRPGGRRCTIHADYKIN